MIEERRLQPIGVTKSVLKRLTNNFRKRVLYLHKNSDSPMAHDLKNDSSSIWFSKADIEKLFDANRVDDNGGLRIYFGVHDKDVMQTEFDDKLMVVLVATRFDAHSGKQVDQLYDNDKHELVEPIALAPKMMTVAATGSKQKLEAGTGLDHGKICPPAQCPLT
ncbi:hypothetical protein GCM10023149_45820 [Mucilaginibacter gynuensis]|uniref:Uncharacterized protein n=1 Tax=Mucilaginibacter gynuensis TaxID=1302236 RepID=A0ABP8HB88_9SPHI